MHAVIMFQNPDRRTTKMTMKEVNKPKARNSTVTQTWYQGFSDTNMITLKMRF